ncbi:MAG: 3-deoxy-8-phosphooctulonate synthase [Pirellulaceae bacterium]|nr:3-deoxy-8-phosphooctulonate synthase [Planctomycetales bacterium]
MNKRQCQCRIGSINVGVGQPLLLIAGPCVLESWELTARIAEHLSRVRAAFPLSLVFKGSFDKANRTSQKSFRGLGLEAGLEILGRVSREFGLPVTTDIHLPEQAAPVAGVCELLQIPAFLARQTDLLQSAAATNRAVHVKKGQFMSPTDMQYVVEKLRTSGCDNVLLCERGTFFGYGQLVNDMRSLPLMRTYAPVIFDATHSVQQPGGLGGSTGGNREYVAPLARAAAAVGIDGIFIETHPEPELSPSDGANMLQLDALTDLIRQIIAIREALAF